MLSFIFSMIKYSIFAVIVIVASQLVTYEGKTISRHVGDAVSFVKTGMRKTIAFGEDTISQVSSSAKEVEATSEADRKQLRELILSKQKKHGRN